MGLNPGDRLGAYEVLGLLGKGGMGEVWRARDVRVDRAVALKVLPEVLLEGEERRARFAREAKLLASLNHPGIATLYSFEEIPGSSSSASSSRHVLVMELVEGETLREALRAGGLPVAKALDVAAQIATALAAAHEKGIVHRDLKPENVVLTRGGQVKVLDFGLAKVVATPDEGHSHAATASLLTVEGTVSGTASYMSPEQAAGRPLDFRSDQFALGTILYEMLEGRRPFAGGSVPETLAAIIGAEPPPMSVLPPEAEPVRWLVERCLAKDPQGRYASTEDLAHDLGALRGRLGKAPSVPAAGRPAAPARKGPGLVVAGVVGLAAGLGAAFLPPLRRLATTSAPAVLRAPRVTQLTPGGREYDAAISPDGKTFAYRSEEEGNEGLFVRRVSGGEPVRLVRDPGTTDIVYAPDGDSLYYATDVDASPAIWRIGALGGTPRKVASGARLPAPSADGKSLAWLRTRDGSNVTVDRLVIEIASPDGTGAKAVHEADGIKGIALSPDGRSVAFADGTLFAQQPLKILDVATGRVRVVTDPAQGNVFSAAWLPDGRRLVASMGVDPFPLATGLDLVVVRADGSGIERLLPNVNTRFVAPSVSADGRSLVASMERMQLELWKAPTGGDAEANGRAAKRILDSSWSPFWAQVSRDGRTVLFNSKAKGAWNLYTMPADGSAPPRQITFFPGNVVMHAGLSPDGTRVAYASQQDGLSEIWVAGVDGAGARKVSNDGGPDYWPIWSRDGRFVLYSSKAGSKTFRVFRVPAEGGTPEPVPGAERALRGDASPVDDRLVFWIDDTVRLIDGAGREVLKMSSLPALRWSLPVFSPDGKSFTVLKLERPGNRAVWLHDASTGDGRALVRFPGRFDLFFRAGFADGGRSVVVNRRDTTSNVVLVEGF